MCSYSTGANGFRQGHSISAWTFNSLNSVTSVNKVHCVDFQCPLPYRGALHLFPPNLGDSARILDKVHPISAVRHTYLTVKLKQCVQFGIKAWYRHSASEFGVRHYSAQWFKTARYVADINNRQTTESISVVLVSIESVSSGHLVVKNNLTWGYWFRSQVR